MTRQLSEAERTLVCCLARGDRPHDIIRRIGAHDFELRLTGAMEALGIQTRSEAALVHAAYDQEIIALNPDQGRRPPTALTREQRRVLDLITEGLNPQGIADRTGWSLTVARRTARGLITRLRARTPWGAVDRAWDHGFLGPATAPQRTTRRRHVPC